MIACCSGQGHVDAAGDPPWQQRTAGTCALGCRRQRSSHRAINGTAACQSVNCYRSPQTQLHPKSTAGCVHSLVSRSILMPRFARLARKCTTAAQQQTLCWSQGIGTACTMQQQSWCCSLGNSILHLGRPAAERHCGDSVEGAHLRQHLARRAGHGAPDTVSGRCSL